MSADLASPRRSSPPRSSRRRFLAASASGGLVIGLQLPLGQALARMAGGAYGAGLGREAAPDAAPADALDDSETPAGGRHE